MNIQTILKNILAWIDKVLHKKTKKPSRNSPYRVLDTIPCKYGLLKLVDRDSPYAVCTYVYSPKQQTETNVADTRLMDYHICLDHMWLPDNPELEVKSFRLTNKPVSFKPVKFQRRLIGDRTHLITVLKASRWLDKDGHYTTSVAYIGEFDFLGLDRTVYRDKNAIPIFKDVVYQLKDQKPDTFDWEFEIKFSQKRLMGSTYLSDTDARSIKQTLQGDK